MTGQGKDLVFEGLNLPVSVELFTLHFVKCMLPQPGIILFQFNLLNPPGHFDLRPVVQIPSFGALQPHHFSVFLSHMTPLLWFQGQWSGILFSDRLTTDLLPEILLLEDLGHDTRTDGLTTFADSEAELFFHRNRGHQFDFN